MLKERTENNSILLSIKQFKLDGKQTAGICRDSKDPRPGYQEVSVYNPNTQSEQKKWVKVYDEVEAFIVKVEMYDREVKGQSARMTGIDLHLVDEDGLQMKLGLPYGKPVWQKFCYVAENIDFNKPVSFRAWLDTDDKGKDQTAFVIKQDSKGLKHVYTKDNPGELPAAVQSKVTKKWSFDDHNEWLYLRVQEVVAPRAEAAAAKRGQAKTQQVTEQAPNERQAPQTEPDWGNDPWAENEEENAATATPAPKLTPQERGKQLFELGRVSKSKMPGSRSFIVQDENYSDVPEETPTVWEDDAKLVQCTCGPKRKAKDDPRCAHILAVNWYAASLRQQQTA